MNVESIDPYDWYQTGDKNISNVLENRNIVLSMMISIQIEV